MATLTARPVLSDVFWTAEGSGVWLKRFALLVAGVVALWISAKVQIATVPVPVTLQMLVIMTIGAAYGPYLAASTVGAYLMLGAQGLPVFAGTPEKGIGLAYMMGPTGGYLIGFLIAVLRSPGRNAGRRSAPPPGNPALSQRGHSAHRARSHSRCRSRPSPARRYVLPPMRGWHPG